MDDDEAVAEVATLDFYALPGADLPLWWVSGPALDAAHLPLSDPLLSQLQSWQHRYTALDSTGRRPDDFDAEGRALLARARSELGQGWTVVSSWYDDDAAELAAKLDDSASPRSLSEEFERLPQATRAEVARLAKKGQRHPDPRVAQAAAAWAASYTGAADVTFGLAVGVVIGALTGGVDSSAGEAMAQARLAKRLRAISGSRD
jgi:hypothetical protein